MSELTVRNADVSDLQRILQIYEQARSYMAANGNPSQWGESYPPLALLEQDIEDRQLFVIEDSGRVHGVFAFIIGEDESYRVIGQGRWLSDSLYGTIHRIAGDGEVHGIMNAAVAFCLGKINHLRIDTHEDNKTMRRLIQRCGFNQCGIIFVEDGTPRIAYERL